MCLIDSGNTHHQDRFTLCPLTWQLKNAIPPPSHDSVADLALQVKAPWTIHHPTSGTAYINLLHAFESVIDNGTHLDKPVQLGQSVITRDHLKHAGIADIPRFWRLTTTPVPDISNRTALTSTQLFTLYLGLLCKHISQLASPSQLTTPLRVGSIMLIQSRSIWSELASESPLIPLLRTLPATDYKPVSVHSILIRPLSSIHGWALLDLGECLHADLLALTIHLDQACFAAQYTQLPLSKFSKALAGGSNPVCGPPGTPIALNALAQWQVQVTKTEFVGVTHVTLSGDSWTPKLVIQIIRLVAGLNSDTKVMYSEFRQPHLSAASTLLLQNHDQCHCGKRNTMMVRCDYLQINGRIHILPATSLPDNHLPIPLDIAKDKILFRLLICRTTSKYSYLMNFGTSTSLFNHEFGIDLDHLCVPRFDPRAASAPKKLSHIRNAVLGVPPRWALEQSRAFIGATLCKPVWLRSNDENIVLVDWWVVDKSWFSNKHTRHRN